MSTLENRTDTSHPPTTGNGSYAMSVDVEDYFQVWAFSDVIDRKSWDGFPLRVEKATRRILDMFAAADVKATFFTLGWVAERAPGLIRDIVDQGHELGSHGYDHVKVFDQSQSAFREDAGKTKKILEDCAGVAVKGYRAAGFSIDQRTPWAHKTLVELGYDYSSSEHPIAHDHYGNPDGSQSAYRPIEGLEFVEAPVATVDVLGRRMSAAGGGWFRAAPYLASKKLLSKAAVELNSPAIFYFHPWEIDASQPRISGASRKARFRHYLNLNRMEQKLTHLLADYPWTRIDEALGVDCKKEAA